MYLPCQFMRRGYLERRTLRVAVSMDFFEAGHDNTVRPFSFPSSNHSPSHPPFHPPSSSSSPSRLTPPLLLVCCFACLHSKRGTRRWCNASLKKTSNLPNTEFSLLDLSSRAPDPSHDVEEFLLPSWLPAGSRCPTCCFIL